MKWANNSLTVRVMIYKKCFNSAKFKRQVKVNFLCTSIKQLLELWQMCLVDLVPLIKLKSLAHCNKIDKYNISLIKS